jgi:hypothetical protein
MLTRAAQTLVSGILGPNRLSTYQFDIAQSITALELHIASDVIDAFGLSAGRPVIVGHGANGLLAKALNISMTSDPWRVSFEAPTLEDTPIAAFANQTSDDRNRSRIFNFYSEGSIYAISDNRALINHRIPNYGLAPLVSPNPFQTFCFAVAACLSDSRFDLLCSDVLDGQEHFREIWEGLGRHRSD